MDAVDQPKVERHAMKTMDEKDIKHFLDETRKNQDGEYYALFFLFLFTGLRRNEALALRWTDIDLLGAQLSVNRTMQFIDNKSLSNHLKQKLPAVNCAKSHHLYNAKTPPRSQNKIRQLLVLCRYPIRI